MAAFDDEQKRFVVRCWAYRMSSSEILTEFTERFPKADKPPSSQIALYKPCNKAGTTLSADLKQLFDETRLHADRALEEIDGFHLSFRLRELTDLYRIAKKQRSTVVAADILEQIARDKGGMFQARISSAEVDAYIEKQGNALRAGVDMHVTNPQERDRVHAHVKKVLEAEGEADPS